MSMLETYNILKMGHYRPKYYRDRIEEWLDSVHEKDVVWYPYGTGPTNTEFDKLFAYENKYDHYWTQTHFIRIDTYWNVEQDHSVIELAIHDDQITYAVMENDWDIQLIQSIDCFDDFAMTLFTEIYDEMNKNCAGVWYRLEDSE